MMLVDGLRSKDEPTDENGNPIDESNVVHRELKSKEDIKNYIKGII